MKNKFFSPCLAFGALFLATGGSLFAQNYNHPGNPANVGNYGGVYQTILTQAALGATTSDGQDVHSGLTVVVGQPIPTVTFSISGPGVNPPASWLAVLAPPSVPITTLVSLGVGNDVEMVAENNSGIAPGLSILASIPLYRVSDGPLASGTPLEAEVPGASIVQLGGTPTTPGVYDITLIAYEELGMQGAATPNFDYTIKVLATSFTTQPASQSVAVSQSVTFTAAAAGSPTYQWSGPNGVISGATGASLTLTNVQLSAAGSYSVTATVAAGSAASASATLTVLPLAAPAFTLNPVSVTVASGRSAAFNAAASGEPAPAYQWNLNGAPISGATDPILQVPDATSANAGAYTCTASNSSGSATSTAAVLTATVTSNPGYLLNLSARGNVGTGNNILFGGFGVYGTGTKQLLIRGAGPSLALAPFNIATAMAAPQLTLFDNNGSIIASNLAWGVAPTAGPAAGLSPPTIASDLVMNSVGAFNFTPGSNDTSMIVTAPSGNNTMQVSGVGGSTGIGLVEIYDADSTFPPASRLINLSARALVGTGTNILIGGFAIYGTTSETLLIRADGPTLGDAPFSISGVLAQPVLTIYNNQGVAIYSNTGWAGDATLAAVFPTVGAFALNSSHNDSAVLISLPPGNYTAQVSGLNGTGGIALCEIYEVP